MGNIRSLARLVARSDGTVHKLKPKNKKIQMMRNDETLIFGHIRECAKYLINNNLVTSNSVNYVSTAISNSVRKNKEYLGIEFRFI